MVVNIQVTLNSGNFLINRGTIRISVGKYKMIFKKQSGTWSWLVSNILYSSVPVSYGHLFITVCSIMKWHTIVRFPPDIAMHHEYRFSGLFMQDCTHVLLVVAEKDCDACTAETHLRILLVKILQQYIYIYLFIYLKKKHLTRSSIDMQPDVSHVQRIPWVVV
jgi:hypothetical protein